MCFFFYYNHLSYSLLYSGVLKLFDRYGSEDNPVFLIYDENNFNIYLS